MTNRRATYFAGFLLSTAIGLSADASAQPREHTVLVLLQNGGVPAAVAARAQAEVVRLYALIGVGVSWVKEVPAPGIRLRVVSLVTWEPTDVRIPESVLGLTNTDPATGRGVRAYVFWRRVERAAQDFSASEPNLLAAAIAHELGHMLLPKPSHSKRGLMTENWDDDHFRSASAGLLVFSKETAAQIRRSLLDATVVAAVK